jgi:hypothetical protein
MSARNLLIDLPIPRCRIAVGLYATRAWWRWYLLVTVGAREVVL